MEYIKTSVCNEIDCFKFKFDVTQNTKSEKKKEDLFQIKIKVILSKLFYLFCIVQTNKIFICVCATGKDMVLDSVSLHESGVIEKTKLSTVFLGI